MDEDRPVEHGASQVNAQHGLITATSDILHRRFLWLLLGFYALASIAPGPGILVGSLSRVVRLFELEARITASSVMLGFILLVAGFRVKGVELRKLLRRPLMLSLGLLTSVVVPGSLLIVAAP